MSTAAAPSTAGAPAPATSSVVTLRSRSEYDSLRAQADATGRLLVLLFTAAWHPPCAQMAAVVQALSGQHAQILAAQVDAEQVPEVTEQFEQQVESVPTTVLWKGGKVVSAVAGANVAELTAQVAAHARPSGAATTQPPPATASGGAAAATAAAPAGESKEELNARLSKLVRASPVMAFIKGTPEAPRCGFTKQLLALLKEQQIQFGSFDILSDNTVREGLKAFSNWPTYPQVYINGELIGGLDVVKELASSGELAGMVPAGHIASAPAQGDLNARLKSLINQQRVMLFMKGSPAAPQCGFSSKAVALLRDSGVEFGSFDIFSDQEVREGLKAYSNWPTYPQLYVNGELIGGLDVMQELKDAGELASTLDAPPALEATK